MNTIHSTGFLFHQRRLQRIKACVLLVLLSYWYFNSGHGPDLNSAPAPRAHSVCIRHPGAGPSFLLRRPWGASRPKCLRGTASGKFPVVRNWMALMRTDAVRSSCLLGASSFLMFYRMVNKALLCYLGFLSVLFVITEVFTEEWAKERKLELLLEVGRSVFWLRSGFEVGIVELIICSERYK